MRLSTRALSTLALLVGCGPLSVPPIPEERGECTLDRVREIVPPGAEVELQARNVVTLRRDDPGFAPTAMLALEGDGWQHPAGPEGQTKPNVRIIKPDGTRTQTLSSLLGDVVRVDYAVNVPGVWTFIVEWELIDCRQVLTIEVLPPQ